MLTASVAMVGIMNGWSCCKSKAENGLGCKLMLHHVEDIDTTGDHTPLPSPCLLQQLLRTCTVHTGERTDTKTHTHKNAHTHAGMLNAQPACNLSRSRRTHTCPKSSSVACLCARLTLCLWRRSFRLPRPLALIQEKRSSYPLSVGRRMPIQPTICS